jgi:hypothetical protein
MRFVLHASVIALSLTSIPQAAELTIAGAWTLNRDLTTMPDETEARHEPESGRRGGFGRGGGAPAGPGIGGRGSLAGLGGNSPSDEEIRHAQSIRRRMSDIPLQLIISRNGESVTFVDQIGRSQTIKADGKKQERVTGEGEFTSKARFEGDRLVIEDDFGGPKLTTTYRPILAGGEIRRLEVTLKADHMPGAARARLADRAGRGRTPEVRRFYDAEAR